MFDLGQRFFHSKSEQIENWQLKRPVSSIDIYNTVSSRTCLAGRRARSGIPWGM